MSEVNVSFWKNFINTFTKIGHGNLSLFVEPGLKAVQEDPFIYGHLVAWNNPRTQVRDAQIAAPVLALRNITDSMYAENAVAHLMKLGPRELIRALDFNGQLTKGTVIWREKTGTGKNIKWETRTTKVGPSAVTGGVGNLLEKSIGRYLQVREASNGWWDKTVVSNREAMLTLYTKWHIKPSQRAQDILFDHKYPTGSVFAAIKGLADMTDREAAGNVLKFGIPLPIAIGACGKHLKSRDFQLALIEGATGNQIINLTDALRRWGALDDDLLKSSYEAAMERAASDKRVNALKTDKAAAAMSGTKIAEKMEKMKTQALDTAVGKIKANVAVFVDKSGSQHVSVELGKQIGALIAERVDGEVSMLFFDMYPYYYDIKGKSLSEINQLTRGIRGSGGTNIGAPLEWLIAQGKMVDMIVIISDGGDNGSRFNGAYRRYSEMTGIEPAVYLLRTAGDYNYWAGNCKQAGIEYEQIDFDKGNVDYNSLPQVIRMLKPGKFTLLDEILAAPLLTLDEVFSSKGDKE